MGMSKGRSQQTRVQRYNRKHPKAKFCNKRNIKKFRKRMTENALVLRSLAEVSLAACSKKEFICRNGFLHDNRNGVSKSG